MATLDDIPVKIALGIALGSLSAVMAKLASGEDWNGKKFAYSIGIGIGSAIAFIDDLGEIGPSNILGLIATALGGQFIINKGVQMLKRLKGSD